MRILFIHQNFPGQYLKLAPELARRGHEVIGLGDQGNIEHTRPTPGVERLGYKSPSKPKNHPDRHRYLTNFEAQVRRGQQVARAMRQLKKRGLKPDVIHVHPGWGESLYIKDIFPDVPLIGLFEFYYHPQGHNIDFDPEFPATLNEKLKSKTWNANNLLALEEADAGVCPTHYQKKVQPSAYQHKISVIHEGIDVHQARPDSSATLSIKLPGKTLKLSADDNVVTFVNRNLEPYRGYHTFMRALPKILERKDVRVAIVGGTRRGYGSLPKEGTWKQRFFDEVKDRVDPDRITFLDRIPYDKLLRLIQLSKAHVYLTYPFVLSWSMLDAMSCAAPLVASRTEPVEEVIAHERNGLLVDFFDAEALADAVLRTVGDAELRRALGARARQTVVERYSLEVCQPQQIELIERLANTKGEPAEISRSNGSRKLREA